MRGFSLIELLVTIAILSLITAVIVIRYSGFNSSVLLKSQAYEMALNIREAQVYSISVRGEGGAFRDAYGLHFTTTTPNTYTFFLDGSGNGRYESGEELGTPFMLDGRFAIAKLCINNCSQEVNNLSIAFKRPDFDAHLAVAGYGGAVSSAQIYLSPVSDLSVSRVVTVSSSGQISVSSNDGITVPEDGGDGGDGEEDPPPPSTPPTCDYFGASDTDSEINGSDTVTLIWQTSNATSVSINQGVGAVPVDGSTDVYVDRTVTFTLTAIGGDFSDQCTKTIHVVGGDSGQ